MTLEEEGVTSLKFLQTIYRNPEVLLPVRMRQRLQLNMSFLGLPLLPPLMEVTLPCSWIGL